MSDLSTYLLAYSLLLAYGLVVLRILVRREYLRQGRLSVVTAILQALLIFMYGGFPYFYLSGDWPAVQVSLPVRMVGAALTVVGLAALFYGMIGLGLTSSVGLGRKKLQQSGLYRLSRNPQALVCGLYVIGFAVLWPSLYAAGWAALYFVLIHTMILVEEEHLLNTHGEQYLEYMREVPRYLRVG